MAMFTESRFLVVLAPLALLSSCVSHSTRSDYGAIQSLVRARGGLALPVPGAQEEQNVDSEVHALASQPLTLDNAVRIALLNNRNLRAELLQLGVTRGQLVQASLFPNFEIEARALVSRDGAESRLSEVGIGIDLTDLLLRGSKQGIAEADLEQARLRAAGATLDLGYQVRLAYYEVQAAAQQLELMQTMLKAFTAGYDAAQILYRAGNTTELDLLTEQSAYEGARIAVTEAEAELINARERLNVLMGLFGRASTWQISARMPDPAASLGELDRLESRAIESSIELAEMRAGVTAAARRASFAEGAGWLPELTLGIHAENDGSSWEAGPSLTGRIPLFDRQQGNAISRRAELAVSQERQVAAAVGIRAAIRATRARAFSAQERARHYRETMLPLRERIVNQTVLQHNAMQVGVFQLLQARREQLETGRMYVATLLEYWRTRAALDQLLAGRLAGTITTATEPSPSRFSTPAAERGH